MCIVCYIKCDFPSDSHVTCYSTEVKPSIVKIVESESHLLNLTLQRERYKKWNPFFKHDNFYELKKCFYKKRSF